MFVFRGVGGDAEVPDIEIDEAGAEDFHEGVLADGERLFGGELHPVLAGEDFGVGGDDVFRLGDGTEATDANGADEAFAWTDVDADDGIAAVGRAVLVFVLGGAGSMGIDNHGGLGRLLLGGIEADVEGGIVDVDADFGGLSGDADWLLRAVEGIHGGAEDIVAGVAIDVAGGLVEMDEFGDVLEIVEDEDAVLFGEVEAGSDAGGAGAEVGALGSGFSIEFGGFTEGAVTGGRNLGAVVGGGGGVVGRVIAVVLLIPLGGGIPVDEGGRDVFPDLALGTEVVDMVGFDFEFGDDLVRAVFEDEALFGGVLGGESEREREEEQQCCNPTLTYHGGSPSALPIRYGVGAFRHL